MPQSRAQARITLIYGNQGYLVDKEAQATEDSILGDLPRDFAYHRFDAEELVRQGGAQGSDGLDNFQIACETPPFLCDRYLVRLDHLEAVKGGGKAVGSLRKAVDALRVMPCEWDNEKCMADEDDLMPGEGRETMLPVGRWILDVEERSGGPPILHLAPADQVPRFVLSHGGGRRLVTIKEFLKEKLKGKFGFSDEAPDAVQGKSQGTGGAGPRLHLLLERLIAQTPAGLHLIVTASASRESDFSKPLLTAIKQHGRVEKHVTYDDYHPVDWVVREAKTRDLPLGRKEAELLVHLAGSDLRRLVSELDKLALTFPGGAGLNEDSLLHTVHGTSGTSLFAVTERLGLKQLSAALGVLEHFLSNNPHEHPVLVGILARYFRQLLHLHTLDQLGIPPAERASHLGLPPFIASKLKEQSVRFTSEELESILRALGAMDLAVKRHSHLTAPLFRELFHGICSNAFRHRGAWLGRPLAGIL
ncbi:MAG: hypothetical protein OEZ59_07190 [Deltaproteobacteria bacterium]|nr:hypothetical protein [Deltaproteobacteria bacterium]